MSVWDDLVGQKPVIETLRAAASGQGMTHAFLLTGPPGSGRSNAAIAFAAGWIVLKLLGLLSSVFGPRAREVWRYLEARFYDHRVWMLMIGYFALLLTVQLFMSVPGQFQPNVDSDNSQVQIEMVPGTTLEDTEAVADRVATLLYEQPEVERALELMAGGDVDAVADRELPLTAASVREAYDLARGSRLIGGVVLRT